MIGKQNNDQSTLFIPGDIRDYLPDDHILVQVDRVLDLSWLEDEVRELYCTNNGRPSIAPEAALRLMLAGFFLGIVHDRKLMREAQVNLAIRWFAGYSLHDRLPDHSSLTRIRQRWDEEVFVKIFERTVAQCLEAGLVSAETVHVDATLIRADVSWEAVAVKHAEKVVSENEDAPPEPPKQGKKKRICTTDPDASVGKSISERRSFPAYKQQTAVDDKVGVVVDVDIITGSEREGRTLPEVAKRIDSRIGNPGTITADKGYSSGTNYAALEESDIDPLLIPQRQQRKNRSGVPIERFNYDARYKRLTCPGKKGLTYVGDSPKGMRFKSKRTDCAKCKLRSSCLTARSAYRTVRVPYHYESLLRARRRRIHGWTVEEERQYTRHKHRVEGIHGEAKECHGLRRAVRRGRWNVMVQACLTAAVINLKRLATFAGHFLPKIRKSICLTKRETVILAFSGNYVEFPARAKAA